MGKIGEIMLTAALGAAVPLIGGLVYLGKLDDRVGQLERQVAELRQRPMGAPDAVKATCAALAQKYVDPMQGGDRVKDAMDQLGCFRAN